MNERQSEIAFVIDMIQKLCEESEIGIIPYKHKSGQLMVLVEDARDGKQYAMIKNKGE